MGGESRRGEENATSDETSEEKRRAKRMRSEANEGWDPTVDAMSVFRRQIQRTKLSAVDANARKNNGTYRKT